MRYVTVVGVASLLVLARPAGALVLCKKKSGAVVARDACKKKETTLTAAALGITPQPGAKGDKGDKGDQGDPGPDVRAYAYVDQNTVAFVAAKTKGFVSVTRPNTGRYCLTPAAGIDTDAVPVVVTVDHGRSVGSSDFAYQEVDRFGCGPGTFEIVTTSGGSFDSEISFVVLVP